MSTGGSIESNIRSFEAFLTIYLYLIINLSLLIFILIVILL
jgi:hypothetical protein